MNYCQVLPSLMTSYVSLSDIHHEYPPFQEGLPHRESSRSVHHITNFAMNIAGREERVTVMQNGCYIIQFTKSCTLTHLAYLAAGLQTLKKLTIFKVFLLYGRFDWMVINYIHT
jgi:hypothetical protein